MAKRTPADITFTCTDGRYCKAKGQPVTAPAGSDCALLHLCQPCFDRRYQLGIEAQRKAAP